MLTQAQAEELKCLADEFASAYAEYTKAGRDDQTPDERAHLFAAIDSLVGEDEPVAWMDDYRAEKALQEAADLIERQAAQIERMRAALTRAHAQVAMDRELFVRGAAAPGQPLDPDDQEIADEYIALLRVIDEAMGEPS